VSSSVLMLAELTRFLDLIDEPHIIPLRRKAGDNDDIDYTLAAVIGDIIKCKRCQAGGV